MLGSMCGGITYSMWSQATTERLVISLYYYYYLFLFSGDWNLKMKTS